MKQYIELGERIVNEGKWINISGTERLTIFGAQMEFDLQEGFPILTTKKVWWRGIVEELLWFLNGSTNVKDLQDVDVHIWDANAKEDGTIGDAYGRQWRNWNGEGYDQIQNCIEMLEKRPKSTRNVVMAWNPIKVDSMSLPPCHFSFQCLSDGKNLTLCFTMRSTDHCVGLPYNIASYALLTHILAQRTGQVASRLVIQLSHLHIYKQHMEAWQEQSERDYSYYELPRLMIMEPLTDDLKNMKSKHFVLDGYESFPAIKYEMVVAWNQ